jgi:hypothetical protein
MPGNTGYLANDADSANNSIPSDWSIPVYAMCCIASQTRDAYLESEISQHGQLVGRASGGKSGRDAPGDGAE